MEELNSKQFIINYGLITGIVLISFSLMLFFLEAHYEQNAFVQITNTVISFAGITLGCLAYKKANDNKIDASSVRKIGTGISLVIAVASVFYTYFLTNVMEPDFMDKILEISYNQTMVDYPERLNGMDLNTFIENSKPFTFLTYPMILIFTLLFGFLYSVILALFIKTKKQL
jgi:hypothetical protein